MATAPMPGAARKAKERNRAFLLTVDDRVVRLVAADLGPADARRIRSLGFGFSLSRMLDLLADEQQVDLDTICALWWLARVKSGEPNLTYEQAEAEFPGYVDVDERVDIAIIENDDGDEDDSPEA